MLDKKIKQLIDDLTDEIRKICDIQTPITDIKDTIQKLGGTLTYDSSLKYDPYIMRTADAEQPNAFCITMPYRDLYNEKYKAAQMIGELFLDMEYLIDNKKFNSLPLYKRNNPEKNSPNIDYKYINYFACSFLMPKDEYLEQIKKQTSGNYVHTKNIAKYFQVDHTTASLYGVLLGVLRNF